MGVSVDSKRGIGVRGGGSRKLGGSGSRDNSDGVARLEELLGGVSCRNKSCDEFLRGCCGRKGVKGGREAEGRRGFLEIGAVPRGVLGCRNPFCRYKGYLYA